MRSRIVSSPWPSLIAAAFAALGVAWAPPVAAAAAADDASARFDVLEFRVLGSQLLPARDVERAVYPFLGPGRDLDSVKGAAAALEKAYRDRGFGTVFVDVPEQSVDDGIVRLRVTEGRLGRVRVRGAMYFSAREIRAALPALVTGTTPVLAELQQQLTDLNSATSDRAVTPVLKAGRTPGTVDVDLLVKDELPLHGSLEYDNRHTADTTPNRLSGSLAYDNLFQRQQSLSLQYQTAPAAPSQAAVLAATYGWRLAPDGGRWEASYIHTSSDVPALSTLGVLGKGSIYNLHWTRSLVRDSTSAQTLILGVDYKDVLTEVSTPSTTASGAASVATVSSPVHYLNWSATYALDVVHPTIQYGASVGVGLGLAGLIDNQAEFENARYRGEPSYLYLRGSGHALTAIPGGLALLLRVAAQWSADPLVNNEQFALGGSDSVRGYLEAETLGDSGVSGSLEVHSPALGRWLGPLFEHAYGFAFIDAGVAALEQPLPGQAYSLKLRSTGVGARLENWRGWTGSIDYATPHAYGARTPKGDSRIEFLLRYGF